MKKVVIILVSMLAVVGIMIGGWKVKQQVEHNQMVEIVQSEEVEIIIEDYLRFLDSDALTEQGIIKTYKIDLASIYHNPMGGINFSIDVNGSNELYVRYTLEKNPLTGEIEYSGGGNSSKLKRLIEGKQ